MTNSPYDLLKLEAGWDSYGGLPIDESVVEKAALIGGALETLFSHPPSYVPLSSGDMQIEWHCDGWNVEIAIERASL